MKVLIIIYFLIIVNFTFIGVFQWFW
jgi:hypothetical protein